MSTTNGGHDDILLPFLLTSDESETESLLAELFSEYVAPTIAKVVRSPAGICTRRNLDWAYTEMQDVQDIVGDVNVKVLERPRRLKELPDEDAINDFRGYVAVVAYRALYDFWRAKYSNRNRLRSKLYYILTHHPDLAIWQGVRRLSICGFSRWLGQRLPPNAAWINGVREDPERLINGAPTNKDMVQLVCWAFTNAQAPIYLDDLVTFAAGVLKVSDEGSDRHVQLDHLKASDLIVSYNDSTEREALRPLLKQIWQEIVRLPLGQRVALLLANRDTDRTSIAFLLSETDIATMREIGNAVDASPDEFAMLLAELPLSDNTLSKRLGVTRQQVINYRVSARRRLKRRIKPGFPK